MSYLRPASYFVLIAVCCFGLVSGCSDEGAKDDAADATTDTSCRGAACNDTTPDGSEAPIPGETPCTEGGECPAGLICDDTVQRCVTPCATQSDCSASERCDDDGRCRRRAACTSTADCSGGETCNTCLSVCVATTGGQACTSAANCGFDQFCDGCVGECRDSLALCEACTADAECGEARDRCLDYATGGRFCGTACGSCPVGYQCDATLGQCVALSGSCERVRECATPNDCPRGQTCSASFVCIAGCDGDEACPGGQVCVAGACVPPCADDSECPGDATCTDRRCRIPGGCITSRDCTEPATFCSGFQCVPGCEVDNDCGNAAQECVAGSCEVRGCRGNYSCSFGLVCNQGSGVCETPTEPHCGTCTKGEVDSCGATNACLTLQEDDVEVGTFCFVACTEDIDNLCPQGFRCTEVDVDGEGDVRRVCTRQCHREPA